MKIFLTGATGFIGSAVARALRARRHTVIGLARDEASAAALFDRGVTPLRGALEKIKSLEEGVAMADAVVHTAFSRDFLAHPDAATRLEQSAAAAILALLRGSRKPFVYTSDTALLGDSGETLINEDSPFRPPAALAWRSEVERNVLAAGHGIVLRVPLVYGRGDGWMPRLLISAARREGESFYVGDGHNLIPTTHVDDLAEAYALAIQHAPAGRLYHAVSTDTTGRALAEAVGRLIGRPEKTRSLSLAEARARLPDIHRFADRQRFNPLRIRTELSWNPKALRIEDDIELSYRDARF